MHLMDFVTACSLNYLWKLMSSKYHYIMKVDGSNKTVNGLSNANKGWVDQVNVLIVNS